MTLSIMSYHRIISIFVVAVLGGGLKYISVIDQALKTYFAVQ